MSPVIDVANLLHVHKTNANIKQMIKDALEIIENRFVVFLKNKTQIYVFQYFIYVFFLKINKNLPIRTVVNTSQVFKKVSELSTNMNQMFELLETSSPSSLSSPPSTQSVPSIKISNSSSSVENNEQNNIPPPLRTPSPTSKDHSPLSSPQRSPRDDKDKESSPRVCLYSEKKKQNL